MKVIDLLNKIANYEEIPRFYVDDETREYYMKDGFLFKHNTCFEDDEFDEEVSWNMYGKWFNEDITIVDEIERLNNNWNELRKWIVNNKHNENTEENYLVVDYGTLLGKMSELKGVDK